MEEYTVKTDDFNLLGGGIIFGTFYGNKEELVISTHNTITKEIYLRVHKKNLRGLIEFLEKFEKEIKDK